MKSLLNVILLAGRIILPAILSCLLVLCFLGGYKEYLIIGTFGIAIILFNYGKTKYNYFLSFLISVILSYIVFFLSIVIPGVVGYIVTLGNSDKKIEGVILGYDINALLFLIPTAIVSPLIMFYSYRILFKIEKTSYFNYIKLISVLILVLLGMFQDFYNNNYTYIYWQVIMLLALQLILYQKELEVLFNRSKKE